MILSHHLVSLLSVCDCSKCGWDHVVEGLVMLGFHLMDTCAPKTSSEPPPPLSLFLSTDWVECLLP